MVMDRQHLLTMIVLTFLRLYDDNPCLTVPTFYPSPLEIQEKFLTMWIVVAMNWFSMSEESMFMSTLGRFVIEVVLGQKMRGKEGSPIQDLILD